MSEIEIISMSTKGQVVIPRAVRQEAKLGKTAKLIVYSRKGTIIMKKLKLPNLRKEWEEISKEGQKFAKEKGITEKDVLEDD